MNFNKHYNLSGKHAFLSASKYSWLRYSDDKIAESYSNWQSVARGTELHEYAAQAIKLGRRQPRNNDTVNQYINDAIGFRMTPEQVLYYSPVCFGTADAIGFRDGKLRIHDLKTGTHPASMDQLRIYAALFCLEYDVRPSDISIELRIYQNNEVFVLEPELDEIVHVMDRIVTADRIIQSMRMEDSAWPTTEIV